MKVSNLILVLMLGLMVGGDASAKVGGVDGGGGVGVRCATASGAPKAFELLDLHEARISGSQNPYHPKSEDEAIDLGSTLWANLVWNPDTVPLAQYQKMMSENMRVFFEGGEIKDPDTGKVVLSVRYVPSLPLSNDIGNYKILPGCTLEQIAYFDDGSETLNVAQNWNDLDWVDRTALISHESAYWNERQIFAMEYFGQQKIMTSERARTFVGQMFSATGLPGESDSIPAKGFAKCVSTQNSGDDLTYAYVYNDGLGNAVAIFSLIHDHHSIYQLKAVFSGVDTTALTDLVNGSASGTAPLVFNGEPNSPLFIIKLTKAPGTGIAFDLFQDQGGKTIPLAPTQNLNCWFPYDPGN